ncbi:MAG TPA: hypothetical protein VFJ61_07670 [Solirubrobacterales bacterium]|nr:hypothetical protein [Solirubrobacterales bacterium]
MRRTSQVGALVAVAAAVLALGVSAVTAAGPEENVKSTITIGASGYQGKVKAADPSCVGERTVVLKQKGNGVLSRVKSKPNGNWKADLDELNENLKIPAMVYAEVKAANPPGPTATCLGAVSRTVEIAGG